MSGATAVAISMSTASWNEQERASFGPNRSTAQARTRPAGADSKADDCSAISARSRVRIGVGVHQAHARLSLSGLLLPIRHDPGSVAPGTLFPPGRPASSIGPHLFRPFRCGLRQLRGSASDI